MASLLDSVREVFLALNFSGKMIALLPFAIVLCDRFDGLLLPDKKFAFDDRDYGSRIR